MSRERGKETESVERQSKERRLPYWTKWVAFIGSVLAISLALYQGFQGRALERQRLTLQLLKEWNSQTSGVRSSIDRIRRLNVSENRWEHCPINEELAKEIDGANSNAPQVSTTYKEMVSIVNHLEYIASAYEIGAADPTMIEESFLPVMSRWYCIMLPFIEEHRERTGVDSWPPLTRVVETWLKDSVRKSSKASSPSTEHGCRIALHLPPNATCDSPLVSGHGE